jgi:flagellar hook-length control protein FliK
MISNIPGNTLGNPELLNGVDPSVDSLKSREDFAALLMLMLIGLPLTKVDAAVPAATSAAVFSCTETACLGEAPPMPQLATLTAASAETTQTTSQEIADLIVTLDANAKNNTSELSLCSTVSNTGLEGEISYRSPTVEARKKDVERPAIDVPLSETQTDFQAEETLVRLVPASENAAVNTEGQSGSEKFQTRPRGDQTGHTDNVVRISPKASAEANRFAAAKTDQIDNAAQNGWELRTDNQKISSTEFRRQAPFDATFLERSELNHNDGELVVREQKVELTHFPAATTILQHNNNAMPTKNDPIATLPGRVIHHVANEIAVQVRHKQNEVLIALDPPELGNLRIALTIEGDKVHARIIAEFHDSGSLIHNHLPELKEALQVHLLDLMEVHIDSGNWNGSQGDLNGHFLADHGDRRQWRGESDTGSTPGEPVPTPAIEPTGSVGRFSRWA